MNKDRLKLFVEWYKLLITKGYGRIMCVEYAWHNSKYFKIDGNYK